MNTKKRKKSFLDMVLESMLKTGGCCGSGENCCKPSKQNDKPEKKKNDLVDNTVNYDRI